MTKFFYVTNPLNRDGTIDLEEGQLLTVSTTDNPNIVDNKDAWVLARVDEDGKYKDPYERDPLEGVESVELSSAGLIPPFFKATIRVNGNEDNLQRCAINPTAVAVVKESKDGAAEIVLAGDSLHYQLDDAFEPLTEILCGDPLVLDNPIARDEGDKL